MKLTENLNNHLLLNYIRGIGKVLEDEWQKNAQTLGLTLAEQHVMWIVHSESKVSISNIAKIGLWDRSTVMQIIKRLQAKKLIKMTKDDQDLRVTYIELTKQGKEKRELSKEKDYKLFDFINQYETGNEAFMDELVRFHREVNKYFHGEEFVDWVERTTVEYEESK
ncbi:MarR family transcriptional regulator [Bacillus shivajii]|uniref:MarR family winged helix-turn-helix transcriptional regulator n=1 Tax=Bacillus shivajii TaxID=1983719 RepID=UPI001CF9A4FB|nr:MarR family transcriptional regulator [Bacillus shivajii]UCZ54640.1 MarR family transcriptional regulator [Bacillus shivajii]